MMVLSAVQLIQALKMDGCGASPNHGFNRQYDTDNQLLINSVLTIDIERLMNDVQGTMPTFYSDYKMESWFDVYAQQQKQELDP